jgi:hypothetical protein
MNEEIDSDLLEAELDSLKESATSMGVSFHPSIGYDKLKKKIEEHLAEESTEGDESTKADNVVAIGRETKAQKSNRLKKEHSKLVRIRLTCMNPLKREYEGEVFTVSNRVVGTLKRMVPFDAVWHVPQIMLNVIRERECQVFQSIRDNYGRTSRKGKMIKEFGIELLPSLTGAELQDLAQRQAMANGTSEATR